MEYLAIDYNDKQYNVREVNEWFDEKFQLGLDFPNVKLIFFRIHPIQLLKY